MEFGTFFCLSRHEFISAFPEYELLDKSAVSDPIQSSSPLQDNPSNGDPSIQDTREAKSPSTSCVLCDAKFPDAQEQRRHVKSDWHGYNLKQKIRGGQQVTEIEFDKLVEDLNESLSGSDTSASEDEDDPKESTLTTLLKKQARIGHPEADEIDELASRRRKRGAGKPPLIWFSTTLLPSNTSLGLYRALFTTAEQEQGSDLVKILRNKQLQPTPSKRSPDGSDGVSLPSTMTSPHIFLCMVGGGHFAGSIVSLAPKVGKKSAVAEEQGTRSELFLRNGEVSSTSPNSFSSGRPGVQTDERYSALTTAKSSGTMTPEIEDSHSPPAAQHKKN
ncbi:MAG: hypothetical protein Q9203_005904 [Teloschistes exilis]